MPDIYVYIFICIYQSLHPSARKLLAVLLYIYKQIDVSRDMNMTIEAAA